MQALGQGLALTCLPPSCPQVEKSLALAGSIASANVRLIFSPDPQQQVVNMLSLLWRGVELLTALTALRRDYRLLHVEVFKMQVSRIGVHKV